MTEQILYSERVVSGADTLTIGPARITVSGGVITEVLHGSAAPSPEDAVINLGARLVTPAFINGHTHLSMSAFRGIGLDAMAGNIVTDLYFRLETAITSDDVRAFSRMAAYECLLAGVGTVWDHYYHAEAVAEALIDVGLNGVVAPTLQDLSGPGVAMLDAQLAATERIATSARYQSAGIGAALGPHATDTVSDDLWGKVNELAERHQLVIHSHVAQSVEEYTLSQEKHGCSPVERLARLGVLDAGQGALLVHSLFVDQHDLGLLKPHRNVLGYCPFSQVQFCFPAAVEDWHASDISIMVGTDCGACNDTMNVQQELRLMASGRGYAVVPSEAGRAFRAKGSLETAAAVEEIRTSGRTERQSLATPSALLNTVWATPGRWTPGSISGQIVPGARADLAIWDLDHPACWPAPLPLRTLAMSDTAGALWGMMLNGEWRGERGRFRESILESHAYTEALSEASGRLAALRRRLGLD